MQREDLIYQYRLDLVDDVTGPLLTATRKQERAIDEQQRALRKLGDTSGRVSDAQKAAARQTAQAAGQRAREIGRAIEREQRSLQGLGTSYDQTRRKAREAAREQQAAARETARVQQRAAANAARAQRQAREQLGRRAITPVRAAGTLAAAAGGFGIASTIRNAVSFEREESRVRALSNASLRESLRLRQQALDLGKQTQFNNREVAASQVELATAGFTVNQIIGALPGTLDLAAATGYDLAASANLQASTLRAFGLEAGAATKVADVLANTANTSAVNMDDLGEAMSYVAPVAKQFHQSMEDVLAATGILGNVGIRGSQAGTTIRTALTRLAAPSKQAREALDDLGISTRDLYGPNGMRPLPEIIGKVVKGAEKLTASERDAALARLFGREALAGMLTLVGKGEGAYTSFSDKIRDSEGAAERSARTMRENVAGSWDQFTGSIESAATALLDDYSPAAQEALDNATQFVEALASPPNVADQVRAAGTPGIAAGRDISATNVVDEFTDAQRAAADFRDTLEELGGGAQSVLGPLAKVAKGVGEFAGKHPDLVKIVGGMIALKGAIRLISFGSKVTGLSAFLRLLDRAGTKEGVGLGARIMGGLRGRIGDLGGSVTKTMRRVLTRAGTTAGTAASASAAEALADRLPASIDARSGRIGKLGSLKRLGATIGATVGAAAAAGILAAIGDALEDDTVTRFKDDVTDRQSNEGGVEGIVGKIERWRKNAADDIKDFVNPFDKRTGGRLPAYRAGGLVPAMVSSGEEVVHQGRSWTVPGTPTAADNVAALLPAGAAVLTFDGQARMAAGASLDEALRTQAPHFQDGGTTDGRYRNLGRNTRRQGILPDAFSQGLAAGQASESLRSVLSAITAAGKVEPRTTSSSSTSSSTSGGSQSTSGTNQVMGRRMMLAAGWSESQWPSLKALWNEESGWRETARNASSGAYGIPQALPPGKMGAAAQGAGPAAARAQIGWGLNYIRGRYGSPSGALAFWKRTDPRPYPGHWYRGGGIVGLRTGGALSSATKAATSFQPNALPALDRAIADAADERLLQLRRRMLAAARKGGDERLVRRYQQVVSLIEAQLGKRVGELLARIEQRTSRIDASGGFADRALRRAGTDPASARGLTVIGRRQTREVIPALQASARDAQRALARASQPGSGASRGDLRQLQGTVTEAIGALDEALAQRAERARDLIRAKARERVDAKQYDVDRGNADRAFLEVSQRVDGTADSPAGMIARAGALTASLPSLQALADAQRQQAADLLKTGDVDGWRQALLSAQQTTTDMANAQADAAQIISDAADQIMRAALDSAEFETARAEFGFENLDLNQQLAGTHGTAAGGRARADFIRNEIIPRLKAEVAADSTAISEAIRLHGEGSDQHRAAEREFWADTNQLLRKQLEAGEQTAENTERLKDFTGSSVIDTHGDRWVLGSGVGA